MRLGKQSQKGITNIPTSNKGMFEPEKNSGNINKNCQNITMQTLKQSAAL